MLQLAYWCMCACGAWQVVTRFQAPKTPSWTAFELNVGLLCQVGSAPKGEHTHPPILTLTWLVMH